MSAHRYLCLLLLSASLWSADGPATPAAKQEAPADPIKLFADAKKRAEAGEAKAMFELGLNHLLGFGTRIDKAAAAEWIHRAAEKGHPDAYFVYGQICQRGEIRPKDQQEALRWFRLAAMHQNPDAELSLAQAYQDGQGVAEDAKEAHRWMQLSATHGHPIAQETLGFELCESKDPAQRREANEWLRKAALQGNARACVLLGTNHIMGRGTPKNVALGFAWVLLGEKEGDDEVRTVAGAYKRDASKADLAKATVLARGLAEKLEYHPIYALGPERLAEYRNFKAQFERAQGGKAEEQYQLACLYYNGTGTLEDPVEAAKWCEKAAKQGHLQAMKNLAFSYRDGDGVDQNEQEMLIWLRKAAELGDANAQCEVSLYLQHRNSGPADLAEAGVWQRKAAEQGNPVAQGNLGSELMQTNDPARFAEALRWFKLSAMQGHPRGMVKYGMMLYMGVGAPKDEVEGAAWLIACDPKDDDDLRKTIKDVLAKVPAEQLSKAEAAAIEIRKTLLTR
jgi:TPR repeat protein